MSRAIIPTVVVGNEFVIPRPKLKVEVLDPISEPVVSIPIVPAYAASERTFAVTVVHHAPIHRSPLQLILELFHHHSIATFALLLLLVGSTGIQVGSSYYAANVARSAPPVPTLKSKVRAIAGLNVTVPSDQLEARVQSIISQPTSLTVGDKTAAVSSDIIKSWLLVTPSADKSEQYIRIKADAIGKSLTDLANKYVVAPVDQLSITHGGVATVVTAGRNGTKLSDPTTLTIQAAAIAKTVMDAKGMQFSTPLESLPFQALTPVNFAKLIEVNVVTKQMYLYDNGQLSYSYPISAGAPATPTPLGQYKINYKPALQDMRGFNADGTKYFQPNVRWISYFKSGGYAIHGNYWRPTSWFGAINSSHGCVSLPEAQAKQVYDWGPIGTTVVIRT